MNCNTSVLNLIQSQSDLELWWYMKVGECVRLHFCFHLIYYRSIIHQFLFPVKYIQMVLSLLLKDQKLDEQVIKFYFYLH